LRAISSLCIINWTSSGKSLPSEGRGGKGYILSLYHKLDELRKEFTVGGKRWQDFILVVSFELPEDVETGLFVLQDTQGLQHNKMI